MKKLVLFLCLCTTLAANAQKQKTEAYIETYKETAIAEMMRTGVPAAITLAQGILESESGQSDLVKRSNNHFGIKCKTEWTGEKTYHDDDSRGECFRVYPDPADSYKDHSDFLKTRAHYAFLFKLDPTDFEGWAKGLKKAGYATNPAYAQRLMKVINDYNLQQYSLDAIARLNGGTPVQNENTIIVASQVVNTTKENTVIQAKAVMEPQAESLSETIVSTLVKKTPAYPAGVFNINHTKVVYAKAGTSLLSLANEHDLPLSKLIEYNDLEEMDVLDMDRLVFIEKKQKKGAIDFHTVAEGETLHTISQLQAIRLENLLDYNNLKKGAAVLTGDKIYLRTPAQSSATKSAKPSRKITRR
jgi:LysM repeat protein